ncbi:unnamed protein product [Fraxinus pennsylvanica]|uniref:Glycosyl transferase 48 domain-containing protein n=1 Tax=Fraxinus pennsylvanica TaxID=56036 RepID=A0AAD2E201_9LAMI|nr:unnamed protein product [Fraxinus pennsylvanica]
MHREGMVSERELWTTRLRDIRLWASYRGQTLTHTTAGMMYYNRSLDMLTFLHSTHEIDIMEGSQQLHFMSLNDNKDRLRSIMSSPSKTSVDEICFLIKFTYVVAYRLYGTQKVEKDQRAEEILNLLKDNEALRVAYIDAVSKEKTEKQYYSGEI